MLPSACQTITIMKLTRPSRVAAALLALVSMMFMQLVLAGHVCPKAGGDAPVSEMSAMSAMSTMAVDMPGCDRVDTVQPSLCHASAHAVHQTLDKPEMPAVQPFVASAIALVLVDHVLPTPANPFELDTIRQSGAPPPPLAIRNCCFRI